MGDTVTWLQGISFPSSESLRGISHEDTLRQLCNSHAVTTLTHARILEQYETVHKSGIDNTVRPLHSAGQQAAHTVSIQSVSDRLTTSVTSRWYT